LAKTVLITGANKGIGYETARQLGEAGHRVWLGARDRGRGEAAVQALRDVGHDTRFLEIAVDDDASVRAAAQRVMEEDGKLDVLVNNAAIPGNYAGTIDQGLEDVRRVYETNLFGPIRVVYAFLPHLKAAGNGAIVNVSTGLASFGVMTDPQNPFYAVNLLGYNSSKAALNAVTVSFAKALAPFGIRVNSVNPGFVKTDFNNHTGHRTVEQGAEILVRLAVSDEHGPTMGFFSDDGPLPW